MNTVSSTYLQSIVNTAIQCRVSADDLHALIPGGAEHLSNPAKRFPAELVTRVLASARMATGFDDFGLRAGMNFRPATFLDVGYAFTFAADIRDALNINARYQPLTQQLGSTALQESDTVASIVWHPVETDAEAGRDVTAAVFAGYATIGRWLLWEYAEPIAAMRFRHAAPKGPALDTYKTLFGANLSFGADRDEMDIDAKLVTRPLPNANPGLAHHLCGRLDRQLELLKLDSSIQQDVLQCIQSQLSKGKPSLGQTAKQLGLSERSLRRRLDDEGISYTRVLEQARREACEIYMLQPNISLAELSLLVGYADQGAFSRAFRGWYGEAPSAYRDRLAETSA